jgi:hypothetical protein
MYESLTTFFLHFVLILVCGYINNQILENLFLCELSVQILRLAMILKCEKLKIDYNRHLGKKNSAAGHRVHHPINFWWTY